MRVATAILALTLLAGCSTATGPSFNTSNLPTIEKGKAQLIVYRPSSIQGAAVNVRLGVDGGEVCSLPPSSFAIANVHAGDRTITVNSLGAKQSHLKRTLESGKIYYYELGMNGARTLAAGTFGLAGLFTHSAVTEGQENSGDWILIPQDRNSASSKLANTKQACVK